MVACVSCLKSFLEGTKHPGPQSKGLIPLGCKIRALNDRTRGCCKSKTLVVDRFRA